MGTDMRGRLLEELFSYIATKNGAVMISCQGRVIKVLSPKKAADFLQQAQEADSQQLQLLMAKATGHFKHGNERPSPEKLVPSEKSDCQNGAIMIKLRHNKSVCKKEARA